MISYLYTTAYLLGFVMLFIVFATYLPGVAILRIGDLVDLIRTYESHLIREANWC